MNVFCPASTGIVTTDFAVAGTITGHDPGPAETMYEVISGVVAADGVQLTVIPFVPSFATTFVGADGAEYVTACAIGVMTVTARAATADAATSARLRV